MKLIRHGDADFQRRLRELTAPSSLFDPAIEQRVRTILEEIQCRGDQALLEFLGSLPG